MILKKFRQLNPDSSQTKSKIDTKGLRTESDANIDIKQVRSNLHSGLLHLKEQLGNDDVARLIFDIVETEANKMRELRVTDGHR